MARDVPRGLRSWFLLHCVIDLLIAVPLLVAPRAVLSLLGWTEVDEAMSRVVAAALFGIGIQSGLGRHEGPDVFRAMLNLKVIWSGAAILGIAISLAQGAPPAAWLFLVTFVVFAIIWWRYWLLMRRAAA